jgi:COMPASS component SWD3
MAQISKSETLIESENPDYTDVPHDKIVKEWALKDSDGEIFSLRYDPDDQYIAYGCEDGQVRVLDLETKEIAYLSGNPKSQKDHVAAITGVCWKPGKVENPKDKRLISTAADGKLYCWSPHTGELIYKIKEKENEIYCCDYSVHDNHFATAGMDYKIRVYDDTTQDIAYSFAGSNDDVLGHSNRVFSVKFHPTDPNLLISGGWDNVVFVWDKRKEGPIAHIFGPSVSGEAIDVYGDYILAGSYSSEENLYLMSIKDATVLNHIEWYDTPMYKSTALIPPCVYTSHFTKPDAKYIIAGGTSRNEVRVFKNIDNFSQIKGIGSVANLMSACLTVDCANTYSNRFAIGCANGTLKCYRIDENQEKLHNSPKSNSEKQLL